MTSSFSLTDLPLSSMSAPLRLVSQPSRLRLIGGLVMLFTTLLVGGCANNGGVGISRSCEFCGYQQTAVTDDIFFLRYVHSEKGAQHEEAIRALESRGQQICVEKGFTQSRFAAIEMLRLMKVDSPHRDSFVEIFQGHARASAHILCTGSDTVLRSAETYLMRCNADSHCVSVDEDVRFPLLHNSEAVTFELEFRNLADREDRGYEHSVVILDDESVHHVSDTGVSGSRSFGVDFKFTRDGLIKNIQPERAGLTMPHGQLGSFKGWIVARASNSTTPWYFVSYQPSADELRLLVTVTRLSQQAYDDFRQRHQN